MNKLYILLEYCQNGCLLDFMERQRVLSLPLARHFTAEILLALEYLRKNQIVHRDLKPGNIVLEKDYHLKLIDFGSCKVFNPEVNTQVQKMELTAKLGVN